MSRFVTTRFTFSIFFEEATTVSKFERFLSTKDIYTNLKLVVNVANLVKSDYTTF